MGRYAELAQRARDLHDKSDPQFMAAYRQAAEVADKQLLPAADEVDKANRNALDSNYDGQIKASIVTRSGVVVTSLLLFFTLLSAQTFINRHMRRVFNLPLLLATFVTVGLVIFSVSAFYREMSQLKIAKQDAFESLHALWRARAIGYEVEADQWRALLDPSHGHDIEFASKSAEVYNFLDAELHNIKFEGEMEAANDAAKFFTDFRTAPPRSPARKLAFEQYDQALGRALEINQSAFDRAVLEAERTLDYFQAKVIAACVFIALLALLGILPRIQEYR